VQNNKSAQNAEDVKVQNMETYIEATGMQRRCL